jgi:hypothetical protein
MTHELMTDLADLGTDGVMDMTVAQTGGASEYQPPAAGVTRLRLVGYVEIGKHVRKSMNVDKVQNLAQLVFELSGPRHLPKDTESGPVPTRITVELPVSLNEKAHFFKLFQTMNYSGQYKHFAQMLGQPFLGTVVHRIGKNKRGEETVYAQLKDANGYTIRAPRYDNPETGETVEVFVDPALSAWRLFLWDRPTKAQWSSLFIDGDYPARKDAKGVETAPARSKNVFQNNIKAALNYAGSPVSTLLAGELPVELPTKATAATKPAAGTTVATPKGRAADDALAGVL